MDIDLPNLLCDRKTLTRVANRLARLADSVDDDLTDNRSYLTDDEQYDLGVERDLLRAMAGALRKLVEE